MQDTPPSDMAGSWRLSKLGSDYLPGIDKLQGCPMVLKMKGESANTSEVSVIRNTTCLLTSFLRLFSFYYLI